MQIIDSIEQISRDIEFCKQTMDHTRDVLQKAEEELKAIMGKACPGKVSSSEEEDAEENSGVRIDLLVDGTRIASHRIITCDDGEPPF